MDDAWDRGDEYAEEDIAELALLCNSLESLQPEDPVWDQLVGYCDAREEDVKKTGFEKLGLNAGRGLMNSARLFLASKGKAINPSTHLVVVPAEPAAEPAEPAKTAAKPPRNRRKAPSPATTASPATGASQRPNRAERANKRARLGED